MSIIHLDGPPAQPDEPATRTIINVLTREKRIFEDNARRNRDAASYHQQLRIIAAFEATIAGLQATITPTRTEVAA